MPTINICVMTSTFRDIDLSFTPNPFSGDISIITDEVAIKRAVENILLTNMNEKVFSPYFGTEIQSLLFNPMSPALSSLLQSEISKALETFEPRISLTSVIVTTDEDLEEVNAEIIYTIMGMSNSFKTVVQLMTNY